MNEEDITDEMKQQADKEFEQICKELITLMQGKNATLFSVAMAHSMISILQELGLEKDPFMKRIEEIWDQLNEVKKNNKKDEAIS